MVVVALVILFLAAIWTCQSPSSYTWGTYNHRARTKRRRKKQVEKAVRRLQELLEE